MLGRFGTILLLLLPPSGTALGGPAGFDAEARTVLTKHCLTCHGTKAAKGGIDLTRLAEGGPVGRDAELWAQVAEAIGERTMPPEGKPAPSEAERQRAVVGIEQMLESLEGPRDPGRRILQRLTREQYNNTIRDLLGVDSRPADGFPTDGAGGGGFDNNGSTLFIPPILLEKYLAAADDVLARADPARYLVARPVEGTDASKDAAARQCLEHFAARAYRQPVAAEDVEGLMRLFRRADAQGRPFDEAIRRALRAVLVSPHFLFLVERDQESTEPYRVGEYELASRLSYFLWSSMPDETLLNLAKDGTLHEPEILDAQVRRMIADPRSRDFARDFAGQWLGVKALTNPAGPDRSRFPEYTPELRDAMVEEAMTSFHAMILDDAPVLDLLAADHVYVNEVLAKHYGLTGVSGPEFRKVAIDDPSRGGVLGMAAILTMTSYAQRTSPVLRGKWILTELLGTPPPPPPPNVKVLPLDDKPVDGLSFRARLEKHREQVACASCHAKLDPPGFGLEGFDPLGRLRTEVGGQPVDDSGELASGETFRGAAELKRILKERKKDLFVRNLTKRLLSYALARGLEPFDAATVKGIMTTLEARGYRSQTLVAEIVRSFPFQYRRNEPILAGENP